MGRFDEARLALEAATGGKNTLILDDTGMPSVMVRIPSFRWSDVLEGGEDSVCSAFIVNGEVKDSIYISKYLNVIENGRAYSLPGRDPAALLTIDEARAACNAKGPGWHLMSNAEWAAIAHWCRKNGREPHGNTEFGRHFDAKHEHAVMSPGQDSDPAAPSARTLTGTGPDSWSHDGTSAGIFDLSGNVWDWVSGLRVKDGEIQVIPDNDSALGADEGENSPLWRAIGTDGAFVAPGTPGTYKYDGVNPGTGATDIVNVPGGAKLNTSVTNPHYSGEDDALRAYTFMPFAELAAQPGVPVHVLLKELVLFPVSADVGKGIFFLRNYGERVPARGGSWFDGPTAGFWDFYIREPRTFVYPDIGFRASYVEL